jgi:hypothetical protein
MPTPTAVLMEMSCSSTTQPQPCTLQLPPLWTTEEAYWRKTLLTWWQSESWSVSTGADTEPWNQTVGILLEQMSHMLWWLHEETEGLSIIPSSFEHLWWIIKHECNTPLHVTYRIPFVQTIQSYT